jgi:hypothetical protein
LKPEERVLRLNGSIAVRATETVVDRDMRFEGEGEGSSILRLKGHTHRFTTKNLLLVDIELVFEVKCSHSCPEFQTSYNSENEKTQNSEMAGAVDQADKKKEPHKTEYD